MASYRMQAPAGVRCGMISAGADGRRALKRSVMPTRTGIGEREKRVSAIVHILARHAHSNTQ
jgi:hypothetical protein